MQNFQDTFKTRKQSFINAFSICMTVPLKKVSKISFRDVLRISCDVDFICGSKHFHKQRKQPANYQNLGMDQLSLECCRVAQFGIDYYN